MLLSRIYSRNLLKQTVMSSPFTVRYSSTAPGFSSTGDLKRIVTGLGLKRITKMIMTGKPNRPFQSELGIDLDAVTDGGKHAIGLVTSLLRDGDYENLQGLVSSDCIAGLKENLRDLNLEERSELAVNPEDIFFSFMPNFKFQKTGQSLLLVTFSFPGLQEMKESIIANKLEVDEAINQLITEVKEQKLEGGSVESIKETLKKSSEKMTVVDTHDMFKKNEILIGNYTFYRTDTNSDWTITEVSQISSVEAWNWMFQKRWKGRLGLSLRGTDFYKILRFDYATDLFAYSLVVNFLLAYY